MRRKYQCEYCQHVWEDVDLCCEHEKKCSYNATLKGCDSCKHKEISLTCCANSCFMELLNSSVTYREQCEKWEKGKPRIVC